MKKIVLILSVVVFSSFTNITDDTLSNIVKKEVVVSDSFSLINDTKDKISIHTGTGFVSLNKGGKTSVGCNVGKEVRWADSGKKGEVIFKITAEMCGKTLKLSELMK
ncbi:hypothetical protein FCR2A7T_02750 [Flavobacterium cauense R2A-7]|uniref:Uncharacterized protein n=1 Tax=Flavobacterium cauense R2A-7 TaxID=1341154 RepID=V6S6C5_9FLAO|nr:hypothetical protein [Flavobacterium cauense]ESU21817.1 hypothetical protein FCR2A7T_02750 [Flavobacterium cauense R2A-7]KGO81049.1 hypothetical protein Q762_10445 [Flavobacterium cauense R2A-7]TWI12963.1 hypothetical protein IP98_01442 [Flavobacterium cauense R2A-7]